MHGTKLAGSHRFGTQAPVPTQCFRISCRFRCCGLMFSSVPVGGHGQMFYAVFSPLSQSSHVRDPSTYMTCLYTCVSSHSESGKAVEQAHAPLSFLPASLRVLGETGNLVHSTMSGTQSAGQCHLVRCCTCGWCSKPPELFHCLHCAECSDFAACVVRQASWMLVGVLGTHATNFCAEGENSHIAREGSSPIWTDGCLPSDMAHCSPSCK
jgi:hypothetical protein